jgi:DNA-binding transcriptional MerR regulator
MAKSREAFRTISEVSDVLNTSAHVLRFWESKFGQIKPVKRAGGRRYYRPDDLSLLAGIQFLLHDQGMTIKGAQKLLREKGVKHVVSIGEGLDSAEQTIAPTSVETDHDTALRAASDMMQAEEATQSGLFDASEDIENEVTEVAEKNTAFKPRLKIISAKPTIEIDVHESRETKSGEVHPVSDESALAKSDPIAASSRFLKPKQTLPANPLPRADMPARCLVAAVHAKPERVKQNAAEIAPLLTRLIALRDEMRHPW